MENISVEHKHQIQVRKTGGQVSVHLPKPCAGRIRTVSGMLVSRQSMICCNSSCIPGVWNKSSYQRRSNEGNKAREPALQVLSLPRNWESIRTKSEGWLPALTVREGSVDTVSLSLSISIIHVKCYFKQENDLSENDISVST